MTDPTTGDPITHVIMFSGGVQSYVAAKRIVEKNDPAACRLLFTDTKMEDADCYRFLAEASASLKIPLITIAEGRTPWQVYRDEKFLGNWQKDPCSKILKRQLAKSWMQQHCPDQATTIVIGFDATEGHRFAASRRGWWPYNVAFPLLYPPLLDKCQMLAITKNDGLRPQRLYELGFTHSNCGGFCCKAGLQHYRHLLEKLPEVYAYHEQQEIDLQNYLNYDATFLVMQRDGVKNRLTMRTYRMMIETGDLPHNDDEWGGCACFAPTDTD